MEKCQKYNTVEDKHIKTSTFCHSQHPSYNPRIKRIIEKTATIAMYVGFSLFGLVGMILAPIVALFAKRVFSLHRNT